MLTSADADRLRAGLFDVLRGTIPAPAIGSPRANCDALLRRLRAPWSSDAERLGFNEAHVPPSSPLAEGRLLRTA